MTAPAPGLKKYEVSEAYILDARDRSSLLFKEVYLAADVTRRDAEICKFLRRIVENELSIWAYT